MNGNILYLLSLGIDNSWFLKTKLLEMSKNPSLKKVLSADKRKAILDAALVLFEREGYAATPIPKIADLAKVATGTIYLYFPSKEDLVNDVWKENKLILQSFLKKSHDSTHSFQEQFQSLFQSYLDFAIQHPLSFSFLSFHYHKPYLNKNNIRLDEEILSELSQFLSLGQKQKWIKKTDPEIILSMLDGAVSGLFKFAKEGKLSLDAKARRSAQMLAWSMVSEIQGK